MSAQNIYKSASEVRSNWSITLDSVVHKKPAFINRTHDHVTLMNLQLLIGLLEDFKYHITLEEEADKSVTGFLEELALVENAPTSEECIEKMVGAMKDYALDYYEQFEYWSKAPNRISHIPYVLKLLISDDKSIEEDIICQSGEN